MVKRWLPHLTKIVELLMSRRELLRHTAIKSIEDIQKEMWLLVLYESKVYVGQVISLHPNSPEVGAWRYGSKSTARLRVHNKLGTASA